MKSGFIYETLFSKELKRRLIEKKILKQGGDNVNNTWAENLHN